MKKKIIVLVSILVIIIAIVSIYLININKNPSKLNSPIATTVTTDKFKAKIISKDYNSITVVPNEGEAIRDTFKVINVKAFDNTQVIINNEKSSIENLEVNNDVTISFNGQILSISPTKIVADKIESVK